MSGSIGRADELFFDSELAKQVSSSESLPPLFTNSSSPSSLLFRFDLFVVIIDMYIFLVGKHLFQRSKNPLKLLRQTTLLSTTTVAMPMQAPAPAPAVMLRRVSVRTRQSMRNDRQSRAHSLTAT